MFFIVSVDNFASDVALIQAKIYILNKWENNVLCKRARGLLYLTFCKSLSNIPVQIELLAVTSNH